MALIQPRKAEVVLCYLLTFLCYVTSLDCSRRDSKIVRHVIKRDILPIYEEHSTKMPGSCAFSLSRDVYGHQEANKYEEGASKWQCNFCGKSFYEERYLDMHFMNRHPESIRQTQDAVCMADFCDVFRCNVVSLTTNSQTSYWEKALCRDDDLQQAHIKCLKMVQSCLPEHVDQIHIRAIHNELNNTLCRYLTCDTYWLLHSNQMSPLTVAYYMVVTIILLLVMAVYYLVLHTQLSHNTPTLLRRDSAPAEEPVLYPAHTSDLRRRASAYT